MPYTYDFAQASSCRALLGYAQDGPEIKLVTTICDPKVCNPKTPDKNRSHIAGGFDEIAKILDLPPDTIVDGNTELYREMREELGEDITRIIPYESFNRRTELLWDGLRRVGDSQIVHSITQKSLRLDEEELEQILRLPRTAEREGFKVERFVLDAFNSAAIMERHVRDRLHDFRHEVEVGAAVRLMEHLRREL